MTHDKTTGLDPNVLGAVSYADLDSVTKPLIDDFRNRRYTLDEFVMHVFVSGVAFGIQKERADKPADNGGDWRATRGAFKDTQPPEVSGEVDLQVLKRDVFSVMYPGINYDDEEMDFNRLIASKIIDHLASRNLLKSEGVCVPGEVIEDINKALLNAADALSLAVSEVRQDTSIRGKSDYWTYKDALEAIRRKIEALRPFLPAEK